VIDGFRPIVRCHGASQLCPVRNANLQIENRLASIEVDMKYHRDARAKLMHGVHPEADEILKAGKAMDVDLLKSTCPNDYCQHVSV
jgi:hypothetical protein